MKHRLYLMPFCFADGEETLAWITRRLAHHFSLRAEIHHPTFDFERAFEASRGQYHSRTLLGLLLAEPIGVADRVLGLTGLDLFIPVLTFVFGEAQLAGRAALVSSHRLKSELYGLPADPLQLRARLVKEAVHELGHTYGLVHCDALECVMHASTYVEDIDLKSEELCRGCRAELEARSEP